MTVDWITMILQLETLLKDSPQNLETDKKTQEMVIHNIGNYLQIQ